MKTFCEESGFLPAFSSSLSAFSFFILDKALFALISASVGGSSRRFLSHAVITRVPYDVKFNNL